MNKADLIEALAASTQLNQKDAQTAVEGVVDIIIKSLQEGKEVTLAGFGTFSAKKRHARMGVNPQKPSERIEIPEVMAPKFKAGSRLKTSLKKGSALPEVATESEKSSEGAEL